MSKTEAKPKKTEETVKTKEIETIEKLKGNIKELKEKIEVVTNENKKLTEELNSLNLEVMRLTDKLRWIPISEKFPTKKDTVQGLVETWDSEFGVEASRLDFLVNRPELNQNVTHWRKLAESPYEI